MSGWKKNQEMLVWKTKKHCSSCFGVLKQASHWMLKWLLVSTTTRLLWRLPYLTSAYLHCFFGAQIFCSSAFNQTLCYLQMIKLILSTCDPVTSELLVSLIVHSHQIQNLQKLSSFLCVCSTAFSQQIHLASGQIHKAAERFNHIIKCPVVSFTSMWWTVILWSES